VNCNIPNDMDRPFGSMLHMKRKNVTGGLCLWKIRI